MSGFLRGDDEEVAVSFAFQDVITAVLGILILIALQLSFSINVTKGEKREQGVYDRFRSHHRNGLLNKQRKRKY